MYAYNRKKNNNFITLHKDEISKYVRMEARDHAYIQCFVLYIKF